VVERCARLGEVSKGHESHMELKAKAIKSINSDCGLICGAVATEDENKKTACEPLCPFVSARIITGSGEGANGVT